MLWQIGVCKTVRIETRSLYYTENRFTLQVVHFDGAAFEPFARQYIKYEHMVRAWMNRKCICTDD